MKIRVLGSGFYGCHIALSLLQDDHDVEVHEIANHIFAGASGSIPARIHRGFHYPRSASTRDACNNHYEEFMKHYGAFTHSVPINIYAIAQDESLIDFPTYKKVLQDSVEFITIDYPEEFGLRNVEGAILTGERHIIIDKIRNYFKNALKDSLILNKAPEDSSADRYDWTIDATFCANQNIGVDRYEPCLVVILKGNTDTAVTIMDGPFSSLYPWDEEQGLSSLSSARWTPFSKTCKTYEEAKEIINDLTTEDLESRGKQMMDSLAKFYPKVYDYEQVDYKTSIRAIPRSKADARLIEVEKTDTKTIRIRAGKIDAVISAEEEIKDLIYDRNNR